jgi:hypothetical protein
MEITKQTGAAITYTGVVTTTLKQGSKILSTTRYHNSGLPNLFKGLRNLFMGAPGASIVPQYLALYTFKTDAQAEAAKNYSWQELIKLDESGAAAISGLVRVSPYIPLAVVSPVGENSLALQFKVAGTQVTSGSKIYVLALFPQKFDEKTDPESSAIAMYKLTDDAGNWQAETIIHASTLAIEWQMSFANAT